MKAFSGSKPAEARYAGMACEVVCEGGGDNLLGVMMRLKSVINSSIRVKTVCGLREPVAPVPASRARDVYIASALN